MGRRIGWLLAPGLLLAAHLANAAPLLVTNGRADDPRVQQLVHPDADGVIPRVIGVGAFADLFDVLSLTGRSSDDDCGGPVALDAWRAELDEGRSETTMLQTAKALSTFASAEAETACLDRPPAASDLVRLELALTDLHRQLAQVADDPQERASHQSEASAAMDRAAVFGIGLAAPAGFDSGLLDDFDARRAVLAASNNARQPRILFAGRVVGTRLNGRPVEQGVTPGVAGMNLLEAVDGGKVTASLLVRLAPGSSTLVWVEPGGQPKQLGDIALALDHLAANATDDGLLSGAARLVAEAPVAPGDPLDVRFAAVRSNGVDLYEVRGDTLAGVEAVDAVVHNAVRAWRGALTIGPLLRYEARPGAAGAPSGMAMGLELAGSYAVGGALHGLVLGASVRPASTRTALSTESGGGSRFRATVPSAVEARWERPDRGLTPVFGAQFGVDILGAPYPAAPYGAAVAGVAAGIGQAGGVRAEARFGGGPGLLFGDLTLATEVRF